MRAATSARDKITAYVTGLVEVQRRLAPVFLALRDAAGGDTESAALWKEIAERRAQNMRRFAADLRTTGELRADLSDDDVADIVWSMNGTEYWVLLVGERGWPPRALRHLPHRRLEQAAPGLKELSMTDQDGRPRRGHRPRQLGVGRAVRDPRRGRETGGLLGASLVTQPAGHRAAPCTCTPARPRPGTSWTAR